MTKSYEELVASFGKLPGGLNSFAPIVLMAASSVVAMVKANGLCVDLIKFLGTPIIALAVGAVFAIIQLKLAGKIGNLYEITNETLKTVGPILFVTAAGGVFGKVIASTSIVDYIKENVEVLKVLGVFFPFLFSAILKTAQGASTIALTITAGIVAPLLPSIDLGSPMGAVLACLSIGAGAMSVSHANDSYFWVVTNFGEMTPEKGYRTQTMTTLVFGLSAILKIYILSLVLL